MFGFETLHHGLRLRLRGVAQFVGDGASELGAHEIPIVLRRRCHGDVLFGVFAGVDEGRRWEESVDVVGVEEILRSCRGGEQHVVVEVQITLRQAWNVMQLRFDGVGVVHRQRGRISEDVAVVDHRESIILSEPRGLLLVGDDPDVIHPVGEHLDGAQRIPQLVAALEAGIDRGVAGVVAQVLAQRLGFASPPRRIVAIHPGVDHVDRFVDQQQVRRGFRQSMSIGLGVPPQLWIGVGEHAVVVGREPSAGGVHPAAGGHRLRVHPVPELDQHTGLRIVERQSVRGQQVPADQNARGVDHRARQQPPSRTGRTRDSVPVR